MDPRFLEPWVNRADHRVFGRKLHPLCFLDVLALSAINSPFMVGEHGDADLTDFIIAVEILARPIRSLEVSDRIGCVPKWRALWCAFYDLKKANAQLQAYFDDYFTTIEMLRGTDGGKKLGAPWILSHATFLLHNTTLDERRIWTAPIGQMMCYSAALEEQLSSAEVINSEELDAMRAEAARNSAALEKGANA